MPPRAFTLIKVLVTILIVAALVGGTLFNSLPSASSTAIFVSDNPSAGGHTNSIATGNDWPVYYPLPLPHRQHEDCHIGRVHATHAAGLPQVCRLSFIELHCAFFA